MTTASRRKILCVDDEPSMLEMMQTIIEVSGYAYAAAANGPDALQKILDERPDLVILDYMMPGMSGAEVFRTLRNDPQYSRVRETPVLLLTAKSDNAEEQRQLLNEGIVGYLPKPFQFLYLLTIVDDVLKTAKVPDQMAS
ncbi:MAG: response regulator [Blastocatellia bacterium]|nr:response regulator [Blastocatellia bacterium]